MLGIHQNSTILRTPKILTDRMVATSRGGSKKVKASAASHQATTHHHQNTYFSQDFQGVPLNLFRNSGSRYSAHIEAKAFPKMKSATLKITLTTNRFADNTYAELAPVPHWFERIEIRSQNGSKHLNTIYGDSLMFNLNLIDSDQLPSVLKGANINNDWTGNNEVNGASTLTYYLPLVGSWFDSEKYWANMDGDLVIDFHPASSIISSAFPNLEVDCSAMSLIIQTENLTSEDEKNHEVFYSQVIHSDRQIDWIPVREFSKTLTAGTQTTIDLDSVVGKCSALVVLVRNTGSTNTNNGKFNYVSIGDDAKVDIVTAGNKSILGSGVPLDGHYIQHELWATHFNTDYNLVKNAIFIPFTEDVKQAYKGVVNGYINLDSNGHKLQITCGSVGKDTVQLLQTSSTPTQGDYRFQFKGEFSYAIPFNASTAQMNTAITSLTSVRDYPKGTLVPSCSGALSTGSPTIRFLNREVVEPVYVVGEGLRDVANAFVNVRTFTKTAHAGSCRNGKDGFTTGVYDVDVYALVYQDYHTKDGKITSETF